MKRKKQSKARRLIEEGYAAEKLGLECIAPTTRELDRAAWEQGWRAARNERTYRIPAWAIPTVEETPCELCGRKTFGKLCEECREYLKATK